MKRFVRWVGMIVLLFTAAPLLGQCDCITTGNCPVQILDNGTYQGNINVTTGCTNDLAATPLTRVCFQIQHSWVGDLSVSLMSPGGDHYLLMADADNGSGGCGTDGDDVDVCIDVGGSPPLTNNTEYTCTAGPVCLAGIYGVPCGGVNDPIGGATEAPGCTLNAFNQAGQPVNGTWSLFINDVCDEDEGYLLNFSLEFDCADVTCISCEADGGALNADDVIACFGDPELNLDLIPTYSGSNVEPPAGQYLYSYVLSQNGTIVDIVPTSDFTAQPAGVYQVCGLSYTVYAIADVPSLIGMDLSVVQESLESSTAPFCGDLSNDCLTLTIGNFIPPTVLDTFACLGECIYLHHSNGDPEEVCSSGDVVLKSYLGCDSVVTVVMIPIFVEAQTVDTVICAGQCLVFGVESYCPPGPHTVILKNAFGCDSVVTYNITEEFTEAIITADSSPIVNCSQPSIKLNGSSSTPSNVSYEWTGPNGYKVNTAVATVTVPGKYTLTVKNNNVDPPCKATRQITVGGNITHPGLVLLEEPPVLCTGVKYNLKNLEIKDTNSTVPAYTYHSGTPATLANQVDTSLVQVMGDTTFYVLATNSGDCTDEIAVSFSTIQSPSADFTVTSPICLTETSTVVYTGGASADAVLTWNFGSATAIPGTGPGPHTVYWQSGGNKTITLKVTENNGCTSQPVSRVVEVSPLMPQPVVNCNSELTSVEFYWSPVPNASSYNVNVAIGPTGVMTSDTSYLIAGLNANQQVSVFVEAISGNACPGSSVQITCTAQDCPDVEVQIEPFADICLDGTQGFMPLNASQTGGDGSGAYTFSGTGVNAILGTFNPNFANIGPNNVQVTYEEGTCVYNGSTVINVYNIPKSDFEASPNVCANEPAMITYLGDADPDANYIWDFNGGVAVPGTGQGPHEVTWLDGGVYEVSLVVEGNNCTSGVEAQNVVVEMPLPEPEIICNTTTTSIEFSWNQISGADSYAVNVLTGQTGTMTSDTSILFENLNPLTLVGVKITAKGSGVCGNTSIETSCTSDDCGAIEVAIAPVDGICLNSSAVPFALMADVLGGNGTGQIIWTGGAIVDSIVGIFDPQAGVFGENMVTATYSEGPCSYTNDLGIFIYKLPVASFTSNAPVCQGENITVTYNGPSASGLTFNWDFGNGTAVPGTGAGPHTVTFPGTGPQPISLIMENANGCVSEAFGANAQIVAPLVAPIISCTSTPTSIKFTWPTVTGATDYQVDVLTGQAGVFTPPNNYSFTNLSSNEEVTIELTVVGNGICPPAVTQGSCIAIDCPAADLDIIPSKETVCVSSNTTVDFELTVNGTVGSGTVTWSGSGIVDPNEGIFDPAIAGLGQHLISVIYKEGNCSYSNQTTIEVIDLPSAEFSATPVICINENALLGYLGNASLSADYDWDLDGGNFDPIEQSVSWDAPGVYTLSLVVNQNGCVSPLFTQTVEVTPILDEPTVTCERTDNSVEFIWTDVVGATGYEIAILSGHTGTYTPPGNYLVDGLSPGEEVLIEITANGNTACDLPVVTASCTADGCPDVFIDLIGIDPICNDGQTLPIQLEAIVTGDSGNGVGTWSGTGVVNGQFDVTLAGEGLHLLTYTYEESTFCIYSAEMIVEVVAPPIADAGADGALSCADDEMEVTLGGGSSTGSSISYNWQYSGGSFPGDSTILNPIVTSAGTYILTVTDNDFNCSSTDEVIVVDDQALPIPDITLVPISCYGENDGAIIINGVEGGEEPYLFSLNGSPFGQNSSFVHLTPGVYDVSVLDANGCENMLTFDIQQPQELNVELVVSIEGDNNIVLLGEEINLSGVVTIPEDSLDMVQWEPAELIDCDTCLYTTATPIQQTTFSITVENNGCQDSDAVTIFVAKNRNVYVPNAFSPNGDGMNDLFMVYANTEQAEEIKSFLIFNRWGDTVHQAYGFEPNDPLGGWDGIFRGEKLNPGVFTWYAEVVFIDGEVVMFEGEVALIK